MQHSRILAAIQAELWAITPDALQQVIAIAQGFGDPEAVAAKLGRPLANTRTVSIRDGVAIVPVTGPIFRYANMFTEISGATSIDTLALDFQQALENPDIKAIVLEMDSPGGQSSGVSEFASQINAARNVKPVIAYVSNLAASAGYWIASAASEIVVSDTALLGSIGVVLQAGIEEQDGTVKFISSQSPLKQSDPTSDAGRIERQKIVDSLAEVFINTVATNRNTSREAVIANFGQGGVMIAADAIAAGMADRIGSLESVLAQLSNSKKYQSKRGTQMTAITKDTLTAEYPDLVKALADEGYSLGLAEGKKLGGETERARIQGIEALAMPGHEALIAQLKFDGETTAEQAAVKILTAEKSTRATMLDNLSKETPKPVPHASPAFNERDESSEASGLVGSDKWAHEWKHSAELQAEFAEMDAYIAFQNASSQGLIRRLGVK